MTRLLSSHSKRTPDARHPSFQDTYPDAIKSFSAQTWRLFSKQVFELPLDAQEAPEAPELPKLRQAAVTQYDKLGWPIPRDPRDFEDPKDMKAHLSSFIAAHLCA